MPHIKSRVISTALNKWIDHHDLSMTQAARHLGCAPSTLILWTNGFACRRWREVLKVTGGLPDAEGTRPISVTAQALKAWRDTHGYTQAEAADILDTALRTYQGWEMGKKPSDPNWVMQIIAEPAHVAEKSA